MTVHHARVIALAAVLVGISALACLQPQEALDVTTALRITQVSSGWFDAGLESQGRNKFVPRVSFRLENSTDDTIRHPQLNAVFRRQGEREAWGTHFVSPFRSEGLSAGQSSDLFRLESERGYTGELPWSEIWLAIPHKARSPRLPQLRLRVVRFSGLASTLGVQETAFEGVPARITSPGRTIADCFRFERLIGAEVAMDALQDGLRQRKATIAEIARVEEVLPSRRLRAALDTRSI